MNEVMQTMNILFVYSCLGGSGTNVKTGQRIIKYYLVTMSTNSHQEVVWFDISVNKILIVYILNSTNHLNRERKKNKRSECGN